MRAIATLRRRFWPPLSEAASECVFSCVERQEGMHVRSIISKLPKRELLRATHLESNFGNEVGDLVFLASWWQSLDASKELQVFVHRQLVKENVL